MKELIHRKMPATERTSMRIRFLLFLAALMSFSFVAVSCASAEPGASNADRDAILAPALAQLMTYLGKPAKLDVKALNVSGDWAFIKGVIREPDGSLIDYRNTPLADAAAHGGASPSYGGLVRRTNGQWSLVDSAIGPTDLRWEDWPEKYNAPRDIFGMGPH